VINANAAADAVPAPEQDAELKEALIRRCSLTEEAVAKIAAAQRMLEVRFSEAALRLGFVTQEDVDAAVAHGRRIALFDKRRAKPSEALLLAQSSHDARSERIRALRTELLLRRDSQSGANAVALLSPVSGEGRSQLSAELAMSFAQLGQPTLLVDADLRRPRQHVLFNADNHQGLSQALSRGDMPYLHPVENLNCLFLLTSGPTPSNPVELLSDSRFERLIEDWHRSYEFVVFDTPPLESYADGLAVATLVKRVLLLSRAEHTPYKSMREAMRRLSSTQAHILGAVVSHF
jgi:receptor protein-tyrosine kinase